MIRKLLVGVIVVAVVFFVTLQLVPYGRDHTNPPVVQEPNWDSPTTRTLAQRACFDCHSNETVWPWYSNIAPISWLVAHDVFEGRGRLNFSDWSTGGRGAQEIARRVQSGRMPPSFYLPLHPTARLTADEKAQLVTGLQNSLQ